MIGTRATAGMALVAVLGCKSESVRPKETAPRPPQAEAIVDAPAPGPQSAVPVAAAGFDPVAGGFRPRFANADRVSARVVLPARATGSFRIVDAASAATVEITLSGARDVAAQVRGAELVYPKAHASGATVLHRPIPAGAEDFVNFEARPAAEEVSYRLKLGNGVAGLRLVSGILEMVDADGAPRLRVEPPYIVGADGARVDATLAVGGCAVDRNPAAPWGRLVTAPGAETCTVRVSWRGAHVAYPAVLDPRWTTTGNMVAARTDQTATLLSTGKVLVACGRASTSSTTGLATAELFDPTTSTWAATGSLTGTTPGRWSHSATQLNTGSNATTSGRVLVAGGINGTTSVNTAQLYIVSGTGAGSWVTAGNLNVARHLHTATLLSNGNVLAAGGMTNTTVLASAAIYNPSSGSGSWTAVATNMATARRFHTATLLTSGNGSFNNMVLIAGGNSGGTTSVTSAQLFNTSNSTWSTTTALPAAREGQAATRLASGNVLVTGGRTNGGTPLSSTLVFTIPGSGTSATWPSGGTMTAGRMSHTATLLSTTILASGQVLVAGGSSNGTNPIAGAELWNGTAWAATTTLPAAVQAHTATLLANGLVLVAGGNSGTTAVNAGRAYDPSFALACTTNAQCATGFCANGVCCNTACTTQCMACNLSGSVGTCSPTTGTTCNDGNACTQTDTCQSGTCTGSNPVVCAAQDQCHNAGVCNMGTGVCTNPNKTDGTTCSDGNACTRTDTCQSGTCTGSNPVVCAAQDQCHNAGVCNMGTGVCTNPNKTDGTTCSDGNACTRTDTCQSGTCTGSNPVVCAAQDQCHNAGVCNTGTGVCTNPNKTDGTTCSDGNACTRTDTCQSGTCTGSNPVVCAAQDQCHNAGVCNTGTGVCTNPAAPVNTPCPDGNLCNGNEVCDATGTCQAATLVVNGGFDGIAAPSGSPTVTGAPNNAADYQFVPGPSAPPGLLPGAPAPTAISGWTTVSNGVEWATSRKLVAQGLNVSPDGGGSIDLAAFTFTNGGIQQSVPTTTGQQYRLFFYGGTSAFSGRSGTGVIDVRINGQPFVSASLTGASETRIDWQPFSYQFTATSSSTLLTFANTQDPKQHFAMLDGVRVHVCDGSAGCTGGAPPPVDDGNSCTADACNAAAGVTHTPIVDGTACDDGSACTRTDSCQAGICTGGNPVVCAAQDQCHVAGTCNPTNGICSQPRAADGSSCDDGNRCSSGDSCQAGTCLPGVTNVCTGQGQARYASVTDLGSALGLSYAVSINNNGAVVGSDVPVAAGVYQTGYPGSRGFRWSASEGMVYLPGATAQSYGEAINDAGVMSVSAGIDPGALSPCRYDPAVDAQPVCQSSPGFSTGINAAGTVTGWIVQPTQRMFHLGAGPIEILPSAPNSANTLDARGAWIDADGSVVGTQLVNGGSQAVRYTATRGTEVLADLLPSGSDWVLANPAFIRSGEIVGWGYHGALQRAFRIKTTPTGDVASIAALPMPSTFAPDAPKLMAADSSNAAGEIVGSIWDSAATWPEAAFVYTDTIGAVDLNTLIDPQSGWTLLSAWGINNNREVVGFGAHEGAYRAYKLTLPDLSACPSSDSCHLPGQRDLLTGVCSNPAKPDGTTCNDGIVCTQSETCQAGTCQAAGPIWTSKAPMATPRYAPAGIAFGGLTYVFGGCDQPPCGSAFTATVEAYDPVQNAWSPRAPMPTARSSVAAATIDGAIYVVGGATPTNIPPWKVTVEAYDPVANAWTTRAPMQTGRASPAIGAIGGKLYVFGGHFGYPADMPDFVERYDPATDVWTMRGPVPTDRTEPAYGVIGGKLYVAGGLATDRTLLDTLDAYDPATDSWTSLSRMPAALEGPGAAVVNGKLYVMGGSTASSKVASAIFDQVYIYDPASDAWSVGPTMTVPRYGAAATASGDTILLAGGYTASGPTTVVDALSGLRGPAKPYPVVLNLPVDDLGSFGGQSFASDINARGTVVGRSSAADLVQHAWQWSAPGPLVNLETQVGLSPPTSAQAINDSGTIVGYQTLADGAHAFRYGAGGLENFGNIGDGSSASSWGDFLRGTYPTSVNNGGDFVGNYVVSGTVHGFRLINGHPIEDIGTLVPGGTTLLYGIGQSGTAVGSSWAQAGVATSDRAVLYDGAVGGLVDLNGLVANPVPGLTLTAATSISGDYIAGWGVHDGQYRAFRLKRSTGRLDEITGGWVSSWAWDVNAAGDIVGAGGVTPEEYAQSIARAFVFTDQLGFKKLDDLIPQDAGWSLRGAYAINASGEITGWGTHSGFDGSRAFHLKLPPGLAATCQARNVCGGGDSDTICLFSDGVAETSPGHFVAVFGFDNAASTSVHANVDEVRLDGTLVANPHPAPPADLAAGTHSGAFLPTFDAGHTIGWTVNGETVTASTASPRLTVVSLTGGGVGVVIAGQAISLGCIGQPDGTTCNDGNACTTGETCQSGLCLAGTAVTCSTDQCHAGACNPTFGCPPPKPDGTACNDANACTRTDVCQAGACVGANPTVCLAQDGCHTATCDPASGQCTSTTKAGTCNLGAFDYDKAGRLIRDRTAEMHYDSYDQLREVLPIASPPPITNLPVDDLWTPGDGETQALANHSNSKGHVPVAVSLAAGGYRTLLFENNGAPVDLTAAVGLGTSVYGNSMNDADAVAGSWTPTAGGATHAFRYDETGFHDLGNPGDFTVAFDINNQNQVSGYFLVGGNAHGYRHSDATGFQEIGTLGGAQSWGWRVDDFGIVSASAQLPDSPSTGFARFGHAVLYHDVIGLQDLDAFVDPMSGTTLVIANEKQGDYVVGIATTNGIPERAYRLKLSTGAIDDIGWAGSSFGYSVNAAGDAVGWGYTDAAETIQAAWILSERTGFAKLNDLIDPASGWDLRTAGSIDDFGDVVGWGYHNGRVAAYRLRIPAHASGTGGPMVAEVHTYGYDGLRTSTTTAPGTANASTQVWFTQDYSEHDGKREHYVRIGNRIIAKVTLQPPMAGGGNVAGVLIDPRHPPIDWEELVAKLLLALLLAGGLAATGAGVIGKKRRPAWVAVCAGPVLLFFVASCDKLNTNRSSAATLWQRIEVVYFHNGLAAGPVLTTNADGTLREERRYEPFGQPVDANFGGTLGPVDFRREQQNSLGKLTDPDTGWSYHGARWMQPQTARWTSPNPIAKAPSADMLVSFSKLHPYQYVSQSPTLFWDALGLDGEAVADVSTTFDDGTRLDLGDNSNTEASKPVIDTHNPDNGNRWYIFNQGVTLVGPPRAAPPPAPAPQQYATPYTLRAGGSSHLPTAPAPDRVFEPVEESGEAEHEHEERSSIEAVGITWEMADNTAGRIIEKGFEVAEHQARHAGQAAEAAELGRSAGIARVGSGIVSIAVGAAEFGVGSARHDSKMKMQGAMGIGVGIVAIMGGPPGWVFGIGYAIYRIGDLATSD